MARRKGFRATIKKFVNSLSSSYQTTGWGARSRNFRPGNPGPNAALGSSLGTLRGQSRDLVRKNALASSAIERIVSNTIGTGIKPNVPAKALRELWERWTKESAPDGQLDFYGQQTQVMNAVVAAGECFARFRARFAKDGLTIPFQVEILESEYVPHDKNEILSDGNIVINGIEFDKDVKSRRVAYWMYRQHPQDAIPWNAANGAELIRVPAEEVLHVFVQSRPGQVRGEPWLARVIDRLLDVESYDKAELVRKKTTAMFAGFVRRPVGNALSLDELEEIWGNADAETSDTGGANVTLEPGTMQFLAPGEEVEFADPKDVGGQYEVFLRNQYRMIAASLGILYEQLIGDYSTVNDRTWRAAINDFKRRVEVWQYQLMIFKFCEPVWKRWATFASIHDYLVDPDKPITWTPPRWPYINPVQDIQALREEVLAGFTSRSRVVSEMGEDSSTIDREQAADNTRADNLGLAYESDGRKADTLPSPGIKLATRQDGDESGKDNGGDPAADDPNNDNNPLDKLAAITAALAMQNQPQPVTMVLPERLTVDAVKAVGATFTEVEMKDEQGRIKSMLVKPVSGVGPVIRRTAIHDADGRLTGCQEEVIDNG